MAPTGFKKPTRTEMYLRRTLGEVNHRLELFTEDASGTSVILELEGTVEKLHAEVASLKSVRVKCANLAKKNQELQEQNSLLKKENASLKWDVKIAHSFGSELERKLKKCDGRRLEWKNLAKGYADTIKELKAEMRKLTEKLNRNSANSSLPPSACPNQKKVQNLRAPSTKKRGGQPGHVGHRRRHYEPDSTVELDAPSACERCGGNNLKPTGAHCSRQITDIVVTTHTTEYIAHEYDCTDCGCHQHSDFPEGVVNEANYGNNLKAISSYLVNDCNVSIDNTTNFLWEASGHKVSLSKGSVHNFLSYFNKLAKGELESIASHIAAQPVVGSDSTYTKSGGKRTYVYTYNCLDAVIFEPSEVKGLTPLLTSPIKDYRGILVHDHDISYYNINSFHAECNVHILRYLKGVMENEPLRTWAVAMYALLLKAKALSDEGRESGKSSLTPEQIAQIKSRYDEVCALAESEYASELTLPKKYQPDGVALYKRLYEYKENHLAFIHNLAIPFDNNASERHQRGVKKKLGQTGGFRSVDKGMVPYCGFLSIIKTASMRGMETLSVVRDIFDGKSGLFTHHPESRAAPGL